MSNENLRTTDLHTHSTRSDGVLSPAELVQAAGSRGVRVMALTDHDTTAGCAEASVAASVADVEVVTGIEVSTFYGDEEYHILGYFVDSKNQELLNYERLMLDRRRDRCGMILDRLRNAGVDISIVVDTDDVITRSHVARAIVDAGHAYDYRDAFRKYLIPGTPGYVRAAVVGVQAGIKMIHSAGGVASLAHPGDWTPEADVLTFVEWGLDALEVVHPSHDDRLREYYESLSERLGILKTGGSDFHGPADDGQYSLGHFGINQSWFVELQALHKRVQGNAH